MSINAKDLQIEQQRLQKVIAEIKRQIASTKRALAKAHRESRAVQQNFAENTSFNPYEVDDIAESRAQTEQQRRLVSQAVTNEDILKRQLKTLQHLVKSPYFGRIDIKDPGEDHSESLYIGTASLMNDDRTDFLIYDWRAPISAIYYNGVLGNVAYDTPSGVQHTDLIKKRQFTIVDGEIQNVFDTNETIGDEMLKQALGAQNDTQMHNIVATIQRQQNTIIRDTHSDLLLVQGVAGSGKTSAILQRIAYLLYHSRQTLNADQIVLFSPNQLFSSYIAAVLPSLGERNMRQVTLNGFLARRFEGLNVEDLFDRYENRQQNHQFSQPVATFLESSQAMKAVSSYAQDIDSDRIAFSSINFQGEVFFSADHIREIYRKLPSAMSTPQRLVHLKNHLLRETQREASRLADSEWIQDALDNLDLEQLHRLYGHHHPDEFATEPAREHYLGRRLAKRRLRVVADAIYNNYFLDFAIQYRDFLSQLTWPKEISQQAKDEVVADYDNQLELHRLPLMHAATLMYLRDLLAGTGQNHAMQHVFIDEVQDYSPAMLIYLRHAFPKANFTILGDSEQALFRPLQLPQEALRELSNILQARHPTLIRLQRSYRSTTEITNFAKAMLPDGQEIIPFARHGDKPRLIIRYSKAAADRALQEASEEQSQRFRTVAVITQSQAEARRLYSHLRRSLTCHLLTADDHRLPTGVLILPLYLAKGLEFDCVIAADVSEKAMGGQTAVGPLYTLATRAMHQLIMVASGPVTNAINQAATQQVQIEHQISNSL